jgi:hypothetical protein
MSRILVVCAAFALVLMLSLPGPASAADRRADGLRNNDMTEVSSHRRRFRRVVVVRRPYWRPRPVLLRPLPYWDPYPYAYHPYVWRPRPVVAFGIGPVWGPGWGWGRRGWW